MGLHGELSLDARQAYSELRAFRKELLSITKDPLTVTMALDPKSVTAVKTTLASLSAEELKNAKEMARINEINSRTHLNELKAQGLEERRQIAQTRREQQSAAQAQRNEAKEAREALRQQKELGASLAREIDAGYRRNGVTISRFGEEVKTVTGYLRSMEAEMRKAKQARSELMDKAGNAATIGGAAIVGLAGISSNQFEQWDRSLRNVNSIAQLSEQSLQELGDSVLRLTDDPNIRKGPKDLTASLYTIYSSGKTGAEALTVLEDAALGASAGMTTTDTAAKAVLATLNSGISGVNNSREAMNVLFATVDKGVLNFEQLASTIGEVLPIASASGISLQEVGAAMATLTLNGLSADAASTDLLNLITKLVRPPKEAAEAFDKLGIEYGISALKAKGLGGVMADIEAKTNGNKQALARLFPDMQAYAGALILLANKGEKYREMLVATNKAQEENGAVVKAAAKQNEGAAYSMDMLRKDAEKLAIESGKSLAPSLGVVVKETREAIKWFNSLDQATKDQIVQWGLLGGAALLVVKPIKGIIDTLALLKTAHYAAGLAASRQAAAEVIAANTTAGAWATAAARIRGALGIAAGVGAAGVANGGGLLLGGFGYNQLASRGLLGPDAPTNPLEAAANGKQRGDAFAANLGGFALGYGWGYGDETRRGEMLDKALRDSQAQQRAAQAAARRKGDAMYQNAGRPLLSVSGASTADPANPLEGFGSKASKEAERAARKAASEAEKQARKEASDLLRAQKQDLDAVAKSHEMVADAAERSARRQIEALKDLHSTIGGGLRDLQETLKGEGVKGNPLGGELRAFLDFLNLGGQAKTIGADADGKINAARTTVQNIKAAKANQDTIARGKGTLAPANPYQFAGAGQSKAVSEFADLLKEFASPLMSSLPKGWGGELLPDDNNAGRMFFQNLLQGENRRALLDKTSQAIAAPGFLTGLEKKYGQKFTLQGDTRDDIAANLLRQIGNSWDMISNPAKVLAENLALINKYAKEMNQDALAFGPHPNQVYDREAVQRARVTQYANDYNDTTLFDPKAIKDAFAEIAFQREEKAREDNVLRMEAEILSADVLSAQMQQGAYEAGMAFEAGINDEMIKAHEKVIQQLRELMGFITEGARKSEFDSIIKPSPGENAWGELNANQRDELRDIVNGNRTAADQTKAIWRDCFGSIAQNAGNFELGFSGMVDGIIGDLQRMAQQFVTNKIFDLLIGLAGGNKNPFSWSSAGILPSSSGVGADIGSLGGALGLPSFAVGINRVPHDMIAQIHANEMIIPAREATMLRALQQRPSQTFNRGGNTTIQININGAQDPMEIGRRVQQVISGNRMGAREQMQRFAGQLRTMGGDD